MDTSQNLQIAIHGKQFKSTNPHERMEYVEQAVKSFQEAIAMAAHFSPWRIDTKEIKETQLVIKDIIEDMFWKVSEQDREAIEAEEEAEAREERKHEDIERAMVRRF